MHIHRPEPRHGWREFASEFGMIIVAVLAAFGAALIGSPAQSAAPELQSSDIGAEYVRPHELVHVGSARKLNLFCMGAGQPTVLFDSGLSDWSAIWALVQPEVAKGARACSYDRAGMGYSDPAEGPRSPIAIVEDMHNLVHKAGLRTPLLLVGHSLGGLNMKLYAAVYPEDVGGMVLVDPAEERIAERTRAFLQRRYGRALVAKGELLDLSDLNGGIAHYHDCAAAARSNNLDSQSVFYKSCTDPVRAPLGSQIAAERARLQVGRAYQETQASELANSVYGDVGGDAAYAMLFRPGAFKNMPLIVLTHSIYDHEDSLGSAGFAAWNEVHEQTARLSRRGLNRIVPNTHHNIEIDDPRSIIDAVFEVAGKMSPRH